MKKIFLASAVLLIVAALFFFLKKEQNDPIVIDVETLPLVMVDSGTARLKKETIDRVILSGERIEVPFTLITEAGSLVRIQFPDKSEIRVRENSTLLIDAGSYVKESGELKVHVKLSIGRIWSNIIGLVTPESSWEVETSNVVATVRGTAFDVEARPDGSTLITGSEHTVELTLINPETGLRNDNQKTLLGEDEFVIIDNSDTADATAPFPEKEKQSEVPTDDSWIKNNENQDLEVAETGAETQDLDLDQTSPATTEEIDTESQDTPTEPNEDTRPVVVPNTLENPTQSRSASSIQKPLSIEITSSKLLNGISEDVPTSLTATLTFSDGTKKNVTSEATWELIGNVGRIEGSTFFPRLGPEVSEFGRAFGSIIAEWKDPATGAVLNDSTEPFEVRPKPFEGLREG